MKFQFDGYDADELDACGNAFSHRFRSAEYGTTEQWTIEVFRWFTETKGCPGCVYPRVGRKGEFLVDYCHTTYPESGASEGWPSIAWWHRALSGPCEVLLGMESEWGKFGNAELSHVMVLDDACKLAALRARAKVMVFSSQAGCDREDIYGLLGSLRSRATDPAPWLCIDVRWEGTRPRDISFRVLC